MVIVSRALLLGLLASLSLSSSACSSSNPSSNYGTMRVTDTLGNVFTVSCSNLYCSLSPLDPNLKPLSCNSDPNGGTDLFAVVWGTRFMTIHAILNPASGADILLNPAEPARPIACTADADCLPGAFPTPYTCQAGLCQYISASAPMLTVDVVALCQADIPWPKECPYLTNPKFAARVAEVAAVCGSQTQCSAVPADCLQPAAPAPGLDGGPSPGLDAAPSPGLDAAPSALDGSIDQ